MSSSLVNPEEMRCCASRKSQISELNFSLVLPGSHARRTAGPLGSCWAAHVDNAKDEDKYGGHLNNSAFLGGGDIYAGNTGFRMKVVSQHEVGWCWKQTDLEHSWETHSLWWQSHLGWLVPTPSGMLIQVFVRLL